MVIRGGVLLEKNDMEGGQHSLMVVLPHPFHPPMRLQQLWVASSSLALTSANHFANS